MKADGEQQDVPERKDDDAGPQQKDDDARPKQKDDTPRPEQKGYDAWPEKKDYDAWPQQKKDYGAWPEKTLVPKPPPTPPPGHMQPRPKVQPRGSVIGLAPDDPVRRHTLPAKEALFMPTAAEMPNIMEICEQRREEELHEGLADCPDGDVGSAKRRKVRTRAGRKIQESRLREVLSEIQRTMQA